VNELRCSDADRRQLQICNDDLTDWATVDTCETGAQCNASAGTCTELPCSVDEQQCSGGDLLRCNVATADWSVRVTCTTAAQCDLTLASCVATSSTCSFDQRNCAAGYAQRCKPTRDGFVDVEACVNSVQCIRDEGCIAPRCTPGSARCNGAGLEQCSANRLWVPLETCAGPAYCNASLKTCTGTPCTPGSRQCSGASLERCVARSGGGWEPDGPSCAAASLCDPELGCTPPACDVGDYRCTGPNLERCSIDQDAWITIQACTNAALCNASAKRCDWARCVPGSFRCDAQGALSRCTDDGVGFELRQECGGAALCDANAGLCTLPPADCSVGTLRCNGQWLERCRDAGVWRPERRCESAALCDAATSACRAPACAAGEYRCPDPNLSAGQPSVLEVCSPGRDAFVPAETCLADQFCDAVHGQCDDCQPLTQGCRGSSRGLCSNDGQEFEVEEVCAAGCTVTTNGNQITARCEAL
jgi:hypothetical protein